MENDGEIITRIKAGAVDDFKLLVEKYHRPLLNFIWRLAPDKTATEDIGQDVFLAAYKSLKTFDEYRGTPFSAWLFTIARHRCFSELRKRNDDAAAALFDPEQATAAAGGPDDPETALIKKEWVRSIEKSLGLLPDPYRTAMINSLRGEAGALSAAKLGISKNTVKTRLFRARERLRKMLQDSFKG